MSKVQNVIEGVKAELPAGAIATDGSFMRDGNGWIQVYPGSHDAKLRGLGWHLQEAAEGGAAAVWRYTSPHSASLSYAISRLGDDATDWEILTTNTVLIWVNAAFDNSIVEELEGKGWVLGAEFNDKNEHRRVLTKS